VRDVNTVVVDRASAHVAGDLSPLRPDDFGFALFRLRRRIQRDAAVEQGFLVSRLERRESGVRSRPHQRAKAADILPWPPRNANSRRWSGDYCRGPSGPASVF
jgi:hypothetical protein